MGRRSDRTPQIDYPPEVRILIEGFVSGLFLAFFIKTGINPDPMAQLGKMLEIIIDTVEKINPESDYSSFLLLFGFISLIASIVGVLEIVSLHENRTIGLMIFIGGIIISFVVGFATL